MVNRPAFKASCICVVYLVVALCDLQARGGEWRAKQQLDRDNMLAAVLVAFWRRPPAIRPRVQGYVVGVASLEVIS